ncbi:hypothetical protein PRIPAC_89557 [Pristionchus pacificus]|uniref:Uncharacterized protein n=1 Tax=Pristionchus pacificus TaxID=54126 RepID=A0A2A6CWH0_PRIPA|nr:hypothetical protein PRIPAC_89557 [Pristionchus pacificus]|eukprot:PDM82478.1 hypothetical protein PRIPAC_36871 [Pristionchus pacificus]
MPKMTLLTSNCPFRLLAVFSGMPRHCTIESRASLQKNLRRIKLFSCCSCSGVRSEAGGAIEQGEGVSGIIIIINLWPDELLALAGKAEERLVGGGDVGVETRHAELVDFIEP